MSIVPGPSMTPPEPEITITETVRATLADLTELARRLPGSAATQRDGSAVILDRLSEELAEAAAMLRALPGRPATVTGYEYQLLAALRTVITAGEDPAETVARALAWLAAS
jgi:hypothetical protein